MFPTVHVHHVTFLLLCIQLYSFSQQSSKLLFVQILFRHGDRAPTKLYPKSKGNESVWPEGLGKLTVLGKKQHYALGKYLRNRYHNLSSFKPMEIAAYSAKTSRCIMSAAANLASFFAPTSGSNWVVDKDFNWQPIPIHYVPKEKDKYLENGSDCPKAEKEIKKISKSSKTKLIEKEHKELFKKLSKETGKKVKKLSDASKLYDVLAIEREYKISIPSYIESHWDDLKNLSNWSVFLNSNSTIVQKLRAGPLLHKIIKNMKKSSKGKAKGKKFMMYSSHDTNVAVVLSALKVFNFRNPPYCATLLFELHEMEDKKKSVRLLYINSTKPSEKTEEPHHLVLEGCKEYCPLAQFVKLTKHLIPDDWKKECGKSHKSKHKKHKHKKHKHHKDKKESK